MKLLVLIICVLYGCGDSNTTTTYTPPITKEIPEEPVFTLDPDLTNDQKIQEGLDLFKEQMEKRGVEVDYLDLVITMGVKDPANMGETYKTPFSRSVEIKFAPNWTLLCLFHELGHALYSLPHSPYAKDIMYTSADPARTWVTISQIDDFAQQVKDTLNNTKDMVTSSDKTNK